MAVLNINLGNIQENCPDLTFVDDTNYPANSVFPFSDFKFHDYYGAGTPNLNTLYVFDTFVFGSYTFTSVSIEIETDGAGNVINAEQQYKALKDQLDAENSNIITELVQPFGTSYRDWFLRIYTYDVNEVGLPVSVTTTPGAGITPLFGAISSVNAVSSRNLTVTAPNGSVIDLGAIKQVDKLELNSLLYTEGETFTLDFCDFEVAYVVTSDNSAKCVAQGIVDALNEITDENNLFYKYVSASVVDNNVSFESKEAGIPLQISVAYTGSETFVYSTETSNVSSMSVPSETASNQIVYTASERGGEYNALLTVVSECDYNTSERSTLSWCYDIKEFDCCFIDLMEKQSCCSKKKNYKRDASNILNVIRSIDKMKEKNRSESAIQSVVDLGYSICEPLKCGCSPY